MGFIHGYNGAMTVLSSIGTGKCKGRCKSSWMRNLKYAVKAKSNPLNLTTKQKKNLTEKIKSLSGRNAVNAHSKTLKKYKDRKSPPYPANENCGKKMKGNDGNMYESKPYILMKNEVCAWRKI